MESIPQNSTPILIVDDDIELLKSIRLTLLSAGMPEPALVSDGRKVAALARQHRFALILLDIIMPHVNGLEVLKQVKEEFPDIECVMVTAIDEVTTAVQAMQYGAYDYLVKPFQREKLIITIKNALEKYGLRQELALFEKNQSFSELKNPMAFSNMIAEDDEMAFVFHKAETCAGNDYNLVVTGETGTGKELVAQIIHKLSDRSDGPFIAVNIAALSKNLFEPKFCSCHFLNQRS